MVHFKCYGPECDIWIAGHEIEINEPLEIYWQKSPDQPHQYIGKLVSRDFLTSKTFPKWLKLWETGKPTMSRALSWEKKKSISK